MKSLHRKTTLLAAALAAFALLEAAPVLAQAPPIRAEPKRKPGVLQIPRGDRPRPAPKPGAPGAPAAPPGAPAPAPAKAPAVKPPPGAAAAPPNDPAAAGAVEEPPGARGPLPTTMDAIAKATDVPYKPKPAGHLVKFNLQDADLAELVNHISGMTGKRFIYGQKVRQIKATVVSPQPVTLAEAYQAFLSILEANGMTVVPHGRFLKIVDTGGIVMLPAPVYSRGAPVPDEDRYITRLYRLENVTAEEASQLLTKFKSKEGDISIYSPGRLLILTDTGANIRRMIRIVEEVDVGGSGQKMWIEPVNYGSATEMAKRINELFELGGQQGAAGAPGGAGGNAGGLGKVIADEQTNSLIVVGTEDSYQKLLELMKRLDTQPTSEGRVRVLPLQHATAEDLANTLTQMLSGQGARQPGQPGAAGGNAGGMFEGEIRVTADKATNSLVITSTGRDYASVRLVVDKLDMPRRQVFIESVIMDLSVDHSTRFGVSFHGGTTVGADNTLLLGGFEAADSLSFPLNPDLLQGAAAGVRGPELAGTDNLLGTGLSIPAFGIVLQALATSSDANVLATPHILATDNVPAEINVGENIPLQENVGGLGNLGSLAGLAGLGGAAGGTQAGGINPFALAGLGGGLGFNTPRQDVGTKIKITPHLNESNQVRLEIEEEISERGATSGALGAVSITKRTAKTTVVVDDQQTVVIGGLMRDAVVRTKRKVPVLGDLPVLGFLFRHSETSTRKTNLLLILTPHVIHDQLDLRKIFERKMQERQEFLDRYFVFSGQDWVPPRDYSKANGLVEDIRQAYSQIEEQLRLEEESKPRVGREHLPTEPIELPGAVRTSPSAPAVTPQQPTPAPQRRPRTPRAAPGGAAPGAAPGAPPTAPVPPPAPAPGGALDSPIRINPVSRSVNVERSE
jgi:general secretion pathway protein D